MLFGILYVTLIQKRQLYPWKYFFHKNISLNPIASTLRFAKRLISCATPFILFFLLLPCFVCHAQDEDPSEFSEIKVEKNGPKNANDIVYGIASYYAEKFHGRQTANGEIFSQQKFTAACNVLPLGTWIQVTNLRNGKIIVVKTNDRLHPKTRRIIDLTFAAANKLGFIKSGLTKVKIEILDQKMYRKAGNKIKV